MSNGIKFEKFAFTGAANGIAYRVIFGAVAVGRAWRVANVWAVQVSDGGAFLDRTVTRAAAADALVARYTARAAAIKCACGYIMAAGEEHSCEAFEATAELYDRPALETTDTLKARAEVKPVVATPHLDAAVAAGAVMMRNPYQTLPATRTDPECECPPADVPACAAFMGCLCAAHARGASADAPCNADETPRKGPKGACESCGVADGAHPLTDHRWYCATRKRRFSGKGPKGGGALAMLLAFGLAFCGAFSVGACSGLQTRPTDPYAAIQATQVKSAAAATQAIHDSAEDDGDADRAQLEEEHAADRAEFDAEQEYCAGHQSECTCDAPASPESAAATTAKRARLGADDDGADIRLDAPTLPADSAEAETATRKAIASRKPLPMGAETILAACPTAFLVLDEGRAYRFLCQATHTEVLILKSQRDAGLSAGTIGNLDASWVR